jgi:hypothetical protein
MKKLVVLLAAIFTLTIVFSLQAQVKFGVVGGLNFSTVKIENEEADPSTQTNFVIGGMLELPVYKNLTIQLQPSYIRKGADFKVKGNSLDWIFEENYIELPVHFKINFGSDYPYLFVGPTVGYLLDAELRTELDGIKFSGDVKEITEEFDYGISFGAGFEKSLGCGNIFFEARYTMGLSNNQKGGVIELIGGSITDSSLEWEKGRDDYKNNGLQVLAGIKIPLAF